jgi:hypothetical protein
MSCFLFYLLSFLSYKIGKQEGRTSLAQGGGWHLWEGGDVGEKRKKGKYSAIKCVNM